MNWVEWEGSFQRWGPGRQTQGCLLHQEKNLIILPLFLKHTLKCLVCQLTSVLITIEKYFLGRKKFKWYKKKNLGIWKILSWWKSQSVACQLIISLATHHILMPTISLLLWWLWISGYKHREGTSMSLFLRSESETPGIWISGKSNLRHYRTASSPSRLYKDTHGSYWHQCTWTCLFLWLLLDNCDPSLYGSSQSSDSTAPESCQGRGILGKMATWCWGPASFHIPPAIPVSPGIFSLLQPFSLLSIFESLKI